VLNEFVQSAYHTVHSGQMSRPQSSPDGSIDSNHAVTREPRDV
jgi:hypothetical protein